MIYLIAGAALFAVAATIISVFLYRKSKRKKRHKALSEKPMPKIGDDVIDKTLDSEAGKLVKQFKAYIKSDESPYNRTQRRRIKRHYRKFLWDWWEIPTRLRSIHYIAHYLAEAPRNKNVVGQYVDIDGDRIRSADQVEKAKRTKSE